MGASTSEEGWRRACVPLFHHLLAPEWHYAAPGHCCLLPCVSRIPWKSVPQAGPWPPECPFGLLGNPVLLTATDGKGIMLLFLLFGR